MNEWPEGFTYLTEISWWIFVLSGVIAPAIALITVSWQTWRPRRRTDIEALRFE